MKKLCDPDPRNEGLTLESLEKALNEVPISAKVPEKIREMLELAKKIYLYGYYAYDFYWLCSINLFLFTETVIKERFLESLPKECTLVKKEQTKIMIKNYVNIYKFLGKGWRIVGYENVNASLKSLLGWLRKEKIIPKRINDNQLQASSKLRNSAAHLEGKWIYNSGMVVPMIWVTIDFVNCLFDNEVHDKEPECIKQYRIESNESYQKAMKWRDFFIDLFVHNIT